MAEIGIRFGAEIAAAARRHGLDPRLLAAVAAQETGGPGASSGRNVVGDGGHGRGVFQIDDRSWPFASSAAAMDPARNADAAASILASNLAQTHGDVRAALSMYNTGAPNATGSRTTWADGEKLGYADSVLRHEAAIGTERDRLVADNRENSRSIGGLERVSASVSTASAIVRSSTSAALSSLGSSGLSASAASSTAGDASGLVAPPLSVPTDTTALSPIRSWTSISGDDSNSATAPGRAADFGVANVVDGDDVFDASDGASDD